VGRRAREGLPLNVAFVRLGARDEIISHDPEAHAPRILMPTGAAWLSRHGLFARKTSAKAEALSTAQGEAIAARASARCGFP